MAKKLTEEEKTERKKIRERTKQQNRRNELSAKMLKTLLCLGENEMVIEVTTELVKPNLCGVELLIERTLEERPYIETYLVKFEYRREKLPTPSWRT